MSKFLPRISRDLEEPHSDDQAPPISSAYLRMLSETDRIPVIYNILATFFARLLLAGYLVFPGTFTSLRTSSALQSTAAKSNVGTIVYFSVQNVSLLGVAATCCVVGVFGIGWLWWTWWYNFEWLLQRLFL
jgi:hypothetical protein